MILKNSVDPICHRRLIKAGTALVIRNPFFGYILFGSAVKVHVEEGLRTMATDGISVYCGAKFLLKEPIEVIEFGLLHELLHIYFNHHSRRGSREPELWNIAVDIYVNQQCSELLGDGKNDWKIPDRFVQPQEWAKGLTAEEIYDILLKAQQENPDSIAKYQPGDDELGKGDDLRPMPAPPAGVDPNDPQANKEWQSTFQQDVAHSRSLSEATSDHARPLSKAVRDRMQKIMKGTLPWGTILRGEVSHDLGWDEATYCPPKVKYYPIKVILPQTRSTKERVLLLGIDISASVGDELIRTFISNVMSAAMRATKTVIVTFDQVQRDYHETTNPKNIYQYVKFVSGDHYKTSAMCVFEAADRVKPNAICILTDGYIDIPEKPYMNTTFVIPEGGNRLPWGRNIVMEHPW